MGAKAAKMLIDRLGLEEIENEDGEIIEHYSTEVIETELIERESTQKK
jgi:LacI family transcriptional regulator